MAQNVNPTASTDGYANEESKDAGGAPVGPNSSHASKRLQQELFALMLNTDPGISAFPDGDKLFSWIATITGPEETVYQGLSFKLRLEFPAGYPYAAPTVRFITPCFHPNVDRHGNICLDILKEKWSALYEVRTILLSIQTLLGDPNNDSPLNPDAARMWLNQASYKKMLDEHYAKSTSMT